jgi:AraC family transcriptional regulator
VSALIGKGDFIPWDGACLLIGRADEVTPMHAHYAIQIAFGSESGIRFRPSEHVEWTDYDIAIIPSRQPHMMDATGVTYDAVLFVEPETREGRALSERYLRGGIAALSAGAVGPVASALFSTWQGRGGRTEIARAAQDVVHALAGGARGTVVSDERILRAITYIKSHLAGSVMLEEVAEEACLSASRFRHLFVEQTGTALRPYVLWRRFLRAWEVVMHGESLSTAAHEAGFADAAHLTRTSHRMFGFPPSALQVSPHPEPRVTDPDPTR